MSSAGLELLEIIYQQDCMISKQNQVIAKLATDNIEKENMINVLLEECDGFY